MNSSSLVAIGGAIVVVLVVAGLFGCVVVGRRDGVRAALGHLTGAALGAVLLGTVGFAVGFFGPMLWSPDQREGPLLGILLTGPLGVVIGLPLGWHWLRIGRRP